MLIKLNLKTRIIFVFVKSAMRAKQYNPGRGRRRKEACSGSKLHSLETSQNARKSGHGHFPSGTVWTWALSVWDGLDMGTFRLGRSGHRHFLSGTVWTYRLFVWDLNLGIIQNHIDWYVRLKSTLKPTWVANRGNSIESDQSRLESSLSEHWVSCALNSLISLV